MSPPTTEPSAAVSARALLSLAWPIVVARATQAVVGFSDALMVAPLGEEPLAAVTTGSLDMFVFIILPMGTVFILQSFAAQLRGRGEAESIPRYAWYGLGIAGLAGVAALAAIPLLAPAIGLLGIAPGVHVGMTTYLTIRLLSVAPAVGMEALGNWYGGLGNTRPSLAAGVATMVTNVFLNYLLIEPRFGLPGYGIAGAAWASTVATWIGFGLILAGYLAGVGYQRVTAPFHFVRSEFVRVLRFGVPNGINWFLEFAAFALFVNVVVGHLGTTELAAFNVVMQLNSVSFMPAFGLASAGAILVGEAIGRRALTEVPGTVRLTAKLTATWMGTVGLLYLSAPSALMSLFAPGGSDSAPLVTVGATMLALSAVWQLFDAVSMTISEALRAAGDTTWTMIARILLAWFVFTPVAWTSVLVLGGGVKTVMAVLIVYVALLALTLTVRFLSGKWREIDLVGIEPIID